MKIKQYKKLINVNSLKKAKRRLTTKFNLFIRLRDMLIGKNDEIYYFCIGCGKRIEVALFSDRSIYDGKNHHASHFRNTDQYPSVEYYEDNAHLSCKGCNRQLHGNKDSYQVNLIKKIGKKRFEKLIQESNKISKLDILQIEELEFKYSEFSKREARRLGITIK